MYVTISLSQHIIILGVCLPTIQININIRKAAHTKPIEKTYFSGG